MARLLTAYAVLYAGFGFFILFLESWVIDLLNYIQSLAGIGLPMDMPNEPFWKFVAISLLWMLGILCWWAKRDVGNNRNLVQLMIYCKFFSAFMFLGYFVLSGWVLPYLLGGLTDFSLGLAGLIYFVKAYPGGWAGLIRFSP